MDKEQRRERERESIPVQQSSPPWLESRREASSSGPGMRRRAQVQSQTSLGMPICFNTKGGSRISQSTSTGAESADLLQQEGREPIGGRG